MVATYDIPLKLLIMDLMTSKRYIISLSAKMVDNGIVYPKVVPPIVSSHYKMYHLLFHY